MHSSRTPHATQTQGRAPGLEPSRLSIQGDPSGAVRPGALAGRPACGHCAQRDLWNACQAAWERNRTQYEALMVQSDTLMPLREARDQALALVIEAERHIKAHRQAVRTRTYPGAA